MGTRSCDASGRPFANDIRAATLQAMRPSGKAKLHAMSSVAWVRRFARNHAWSNSRLHAACARLSPEEYVAQRTSFFPSIHLTLWHIALVDDYYLDALTGGGRGYTIFDDEEPGNARGSHAEVRATQRAIDRRLVAFTESKPGPLAARTQQPRRPRHAWHPATPNGPQCFTANPPTARRPQRWGLIDPSERLQNLSSYGTIFASSVRPIRCQQVANKQVNQWLK